MATIYKWNFYAVESASGDEIQGYNYDTTSTYYDGYGHTFGTDETGGNWTYHVTDHTAAPGGAVTGRIYDTTYYDGETHTWADTTSGAAGTASGLSGLGSDSD